MAVAPQHQGWVRGWTTAGIALVALNVGFGLGVYVYYDTAFGWTDIVLTVLLVAWLGWPAVLARSKTGLVGGILAGLSLVVLVLIVLAIADCQGVCSGGGANGFNNEWLLMIIVASAVPLACGLLFLIADVRRSPDPATPQ